MKKLIAGMVLAAVMGGVAQAGHVGRVADGYWKGEWPYSGNVTAYNDRNVWIDAWVHNLGYNKDVGVLWSDNGWYTANWSKAKYELTYADGAERWGVNLEPAGKFMWHRGGEHGWVERNGYTQTIYLNGKFIEYAIYYKDLQTGNMYWDNNGGMNYRLWVVKAGPNGYIE